MCECQVYAHSFLYPICRICVDALVCLPLATRRETLWHQENQRLSFPKTPQRLLPFYYYLTTCLDSCILYNEMNIIKQFYKKETSNKAPTSSLIHKWLAQAYTSDLFTSLCTTNKIRASQWSHQMFGDKLRSSNIMLKLAAKECNHYYNWSTILY